MSAVPDYSNNFKRLQARLRSLAGKVLPLADDIVVLPGHGEQTSIGRERATNPFLHDLPRDLSQERR